MSSDISWLPLSCRKGLDTPKVIYEPTSDLYGGYYEHGTKELVIVADNEDFASMIAHEYCHYAQYFEGKLKPCSDGLWMFEKYSYNKAIRLYFRTMWWEMEALLFQEKHAPSPSGQFWLHGLVLPEYRKFDENLCM